MRKSAKLTFLLALALGATTVFASCGGLTDSKISSVGNDQTAEQEETTMNETYKERVGKWLQYIEYDEPETVKSYKLETLKDTSEYNDRTTGKVLLLTDSETEEGVTTTYRELYSTGTWKKILSFTGYNYAAVADTAQDVLYDVNIESNYIEVAKHTYALREAYDYEQEVDPEDPLNYIETVAYSYYDVETGEAIASDLKERAIANGNYVAMGDKTYLFDEGKIVKTFERGLEYEVPGFNESNMQLVPGQYADYVCFTQGEYTYRINEAASLMMPVGDVDMSIFPGLSVEVYKDFDLVATYETDCYSVTGYGVLPSGNLYVCEYRELREDATEYDLELSDMKFDVVHTVVDVKTGEVRTVENAFVASRIYTDATAKIKTLLNVNTVMLTTANSLEALLNPDNSIQGLKVKDGYFLAEVQKFEEGALKGNSTYAVLNATTMEIVAELPKIVDSQFGYAGFIAKNEMMFATKTPDNKIIRYTVNTKDGDLKLLPKDSSSITTINGGFLCEKVVYDYEWNKIADLTEYYDVRALANGNLMLVQRTEYGYEDVSYQYSCRIAQIEERSNDYWYGNYISDGNSDYVLRYKSSFYSGETVPGVYKNYIYVGGDTDTYYSLDGTELYTAENSSTTQTVSEPYDWSAYVEYSVTKDTQIVSLSDCLLIVEKETWVETGRYGYEVGEEPTQDKDGKTYYQYFILK